MLSERSEPLQTKESARDIVVVSSGPGLMPGTPVTGGTEDVQVISWDAIGRRWFQSFDAADRIVSLQYLSKVNFSATEPGPLLDQSAQMSKVSASRVELSHDEPLLAVYALSLAANHPLGILSLVDISKAGTDQVAYYDNEQGLEQPRIVGSALNQRIEVTGEYYTASDPACCALRSYTKQISAGTPDFPGQVSVAVSEDDRPLLGVYVLTDSDDPTAAVVIGTAPGTPASAVLRPADRIMSVDGATFNIKRVFNPIAADQIGMHHPGDRVSLLVSRSGQLLHLSTTLASQDQVPDLSGPPQIAVIGVNVAAAPVGRSPGVFVDSVEVDGPAEIAGLGPGIEITAVGNVHVRNPADLQVALADKAGVAVSLAIQTTDGDPGTVVVTPEAPPADGTEGVYSTLL